MLICVLGLQTYILKLTLALFAPYSQLNQEEACSRILTACGGPLVTMSHGLPVTRARSRHLIMSEEQTLLLSFSRHSQFHTGFSQSLLWGVKCELDLGKNTVSSVS